VLSCYPGGLYHELPLLYWISHLSFGVTVGFCDSGKNSEVGSFRVSEI
jgi:hypothetical protein